MNLAENYAQLRDDGYDLYGAGVELQLSVAVARAFESDYKRERARQRAKKSWEARNEAAISRAYGVPPNYPSLDEDAALIADGNHVTRCLALGGFPRAVCVGSRTIWVRPA